MKRWFEVPTDAVTAQEAVQIIGNGVIASRHHIRRHKVLAAGRVAEPCILVEPYARALARFLEVRPVRG